MSIKGDIGLNFICVLLLVPLCLGVSFSASYCFQIRIEPQRVCALCGPVFNSFSLGADLCDPDSQADNPKADQEADDEASDVREIGPLEFEVAVGKQFIVIVPCRVLV